MARQAARPEPTAAVSEPERVVQAQMDACNRHDVAAFATTYAADGRGYAYPDSVLFTGQAALRAWHPQFFSHRATVRATVTRRIAAGTHVIDHETATGLPDGRTLQAMAIYDVRAGRIASVRCIQ